MPAADPSTGIIEHSRSPAPLATGTKNVSPSSPDESSAFRLRSIADGFGVFTIPGTQYHLHLAIEDDFAGVVGERIRGRIHGRALRMHHCSAGGNFIEPLEGRPRIVQGTVLAVDPGAGEVLVDLVVPIRLTLDEDQSTRDFTTGDMVNFYMEPGARFLQG